MPVEGLPRALETMLNAALQEMSLSSFRIEGKGSQTVVTLRLSSSPSERHSTQPRCDNTAPVTYRRKSKSQAARDRRRANAHHRSAQDMQISSSLPSALFLPTPPSLFYTTTTVSDVFQSNTHCTSFNDCADDTFQQTCQPPFTTSDWDFQTMTVCDTECEGVANEEEFIETDMICDMTQTVTEPTNTSLIPESETEEESIAEGSAEQVDSCSYSNSDVMKCLEEMSRKMNEGFDGILDDMKAMTNVGLDTSTGESGNPGVD